MNSRAALLWDDSHLWGLWAYNALISGGLGFDILTAAEIQDGALKEGYGILFVPGGWASNKIKSLGDKGAEAIREFVHEGGSYLGICGGAGLATGDGLGLLDISRKPLKERVPSLSGPVKVTIKDPAHPLWQGTEGNVFNIWWPSQFVVNDPAIKVLATFESATAEAFSSDINVGQAGSAGGWQALEEAYGINLDPSRMQGDPLLVEGSCGKGRVVLSLVHLDTPGDTDGALALGNLWAYLGAPTAKSPAKVPATYNIGRLFEAARGLFELGLINSLWQERGPIVQWRRGVRGLEYYTLFAMARAISPRLVGDDIAVELAAFAHDAGNLLIMERDALERGEKLSFKESSDEKMSEFREELFSGSKSHGGRFKHTLNNIDNLLLKQLRDALQLPSDKS